MSAGGKDLGQVERKTFAKFPLTSLSAAAAETATFPVDMIKTRLQLLGGDSRCRPQTAAGSGLRVAFNIWRTGGVLGFYDGLAPAVLRHLFYTPIRIVCYENLRNLAGYSVAGRAFAGGVSGTIAQVLASPADLIKVRMQADGRLVSQGLPGRYTGIIDSFNKIIRNEGVLGLWRGVFPNAQRAFLVNMGELSCYDQAKRFIINHEICEDNVLAHTMASVASGLCATTLSCPADVVKTRMMNQASCKACDKIYRTSYDCLVKTVKFEGIMALWKGFFPTWARLGPWQFVFWVSYEKLRQISGFSSF
ncbi:mitochondrial uncoupling protein 3 [Phalaenopsis equestris]|uniref:mitochondrial uncoupling protein 3 n=1 Tax=Phalaenopsis equestris TaxID=78828 RepID=UPI0009E22364|nr:mitochondrial uncoupling protein 3 [Phalaenopsis equestris]XP_020580867.1 mitochondrial uncoupling protein 3 [Phalaenopsis equestris]XP_020580868.1 mitochondrial uncoupling protein 3 [Phalaenopsis equestris]XP_020580869.1 mitochondrial uncoupling protein 3 [Phalaenopsis equestris]